MSPSSSRSSPLPSDSDINFDPRIHLTPTRNTSNRSIHFFSMKSKLQRSLQSQERQQMTHAVDMRDSSSPHSGSQRPSCMRDQSSSPQDPRRTPSVVNTSSSTIFDYILDDDFEDDHLQLSTSPPMPYPRGLLVDETLHPLHADSSGRNSSILTASSAVSSPPNSNHPSASFNSTTSSTGSTSGTSTSSSLKRRSYHQRSHFVLDGSSSFASTITPTATPPLKRSITTPTSAGEQHQRSRISETKVAHPHSPLSSSPSSSPSSTRKNQDRVYTTPTFDFSTFRDQL